MHVVFYLWRKPFVAFFYGTPVRSLWICDLVHHVRFVLCISLLFLYSSCSLLPYWNKRNSWLTDCLNLTHEAVHLPLIHGTSFGLPNDPKLKQGRDTGIYCPCLFLYNTWSYKKSSKLTLNKCMCISEIVYLRVLWFLIGQNIYHGHRLNNSCSCQSNCWQQHPKETQQLIKTLCYCVYFLCLLGVDSLLP